MAMKGIKQPDMIQIDEALRLHKYDGNHDFALTWYQDPQTVWLVDGKREPYTLERLAGMYHYLNEAGELYFIEIMENGTYKPIGDVTFWQEDMPIVIGDPNYRGKGIGLEVILALIERGRELGYGQLAVEEIYDWNTASRRCFEKAGFQAVHNTEKGANYRRIL